MTTNKPNTNQPNEKSTVVLQQAGKPPTTPRDPKPGPQPDSPNPEKTGPMQAKNEGEGNRTADREYRDGAKAFVRSGQVDARAKEAAAAVDGPEGPALRKAEEKARNAGKR